MFEVFGCEVVRTGCLARFKLPDRSRDLLDGELVVQDGVIVVTNFAGENGLLHCFVRGYYVRWREWRERRSSHETQHIC